MTVIQPVFFFGIFFLSIFQNVDSWRCNGPMRCKIRPLGTGIKKTMDIDLLTRIPRGGSTIVDSESEEEEEEVEADVEEEDDDNDEEEEDKSKSAAASGEPVSITVKTNTGNPLIDVSLELMMARSKKIENVKATVSRMLKSRPPVESFSIRYHGMLLDDESFVHELIDEEDEDDDDEDEDNDDLDNDNDDLDEDNDALDEDIDIKRNKAIAEKKN
mmetsp:Transcript_32157/g.47503  ORF Transcript_32157/g.47503 Transcript_32157/m.47503 type:complete len:216 (-) Transcript_32157:277-924(-)